MQTGEITLENRDPAEIIADSIVTGPALLFSGQGSQVPGMGKDLAEADSEAMDYWKQAEKISGLPLREIYWEGDEKDMNETAALQPALTVANFNTWREIEKRGIRPSACAGHSLGEFAALTAARVISPKSALEITSLRGRLMAGADPSGIGTMAAIVKLDENAVNSLVLEAANESGEMIIAANYNAPLQTVVSGTKKAIATACEKARKMKGRAMELKVSGAFHSPMMEAANRELAPLLMKTDWHDARFPVYSNVDGTAAVEGDKIKGNILRQMVSPVFWVTLIRNLYLAGTRWWVEISPRAVLGKMLGPSLAGLAGQFESLRIDLFNSLGSMANYAF